MVLGVIGICFAVVALLNHSIGLLMFTRQIETPQGLAGQWPVVDSIVSGLLAIFLLIAAISLVRWQPFARRRMTLWAAVHLTWLLIHGAVYMVVVIPIMVNRHSTAPSASVPPGAALGIAYGAAILTLVVVATYPALVLILLNRPAMKAALDGTAAQQAPPYGLPPGPAGYR
jgi:hypothetical protein